jgi:hypothetical protein
MLVDQHQEVQQRERNAEGVETKHGHLAKGDFFRGVMHIVSRHSEVFHGLYPLIDWHGPLKRAATTKIYQTIKKIQFIRAKISISNKQQRVIFDNLAPLLMAALTDSLGNRVISEINNRTPFTIFSAELKSTIQPNTANFDAKRIGILLQRS